MAFCYDYNPVGKCELAEQKVKHIHCFCRTYACRGHWTKRIT